jgi:hypothetical protein
MYQNNYAQEKNTGKNRRAGVKNENMVKTRRIPIIGEENNDDRGRDNKEEDVGKYL